MGLDLVELVIRFEEAFGIDIPDKVAADLTTPRKVNEYIFSQLTESCERTCLTQQAFYFLRAKFVTPLNISRSDFKPDTRLEDLVPLDRRRRVWADMQSELGPSAIPDLARPLWLFSLLAFLTVATLVVVTRYWSRDSLGSISFLFGLFAAILIGYAGEVMTRPLKRNFRGEYKCAGDLATYLSVHRPESFKKEWARDEVAAVVREIIVDETGVKDFTEDSHFIQDLHLD
jgi:acyl carrier protein